MQMNWSQAKSKNQTPLRFGHLLGESLQQIKVVDFKLVDYYYQHDRHITSLMPIGFYIYKNQESESKT